ncbi:MAG: alpha/beta fold hydrolase [Aliishimia sp.]
MISKILVSLATSATIYLAIAVGMILSQRPIELPDRAGLDFTNTLQRQFEVPDDPQFSHTSYQGDDGVSHPMTHVKSEVGPLIVIVHGSGWHGQQFDQLAWRLRDVAEVKAVTLRGHGADPVRRGDVDYIGQMEDDLAVLFRDAKEAGRKTVMLGHSSGGGLVVRFAGGTHGDLLDGAVLLSPYLKYNAPTMRENAGGWNHVLTRRIIGLSMLNNVGIKALNKLQVVQFNMPKSVLDGSQGHYATLAYSHRLNQGFAPRADYLKDIAALPSFVMIAGAQDEAFKAGEFEPLMSAVTQKGRYELVPDIGHLDIVDAPQTETLIREFLSGLE